MTHATGTNSYEKTVPDANGLLELGDNELSVLGSASVITNVRTAVGRFSKSPFGEWFIPGVASGLTVPAAYPLGKEIKKARS